MPRHWEADYKGPLPGNQLEFLTPFAKTGMATSNDPESRVIAYCNESVGTAFGWVLAPARIGVFGAGVETPPNPAPKNWGRKFSKRANKGASQYKFLLMPGTDIEVTFFNPETMAKQTKNFVKQSVSVSFDSTVSVTEVKLWAVGAEIAITDFVKKIYAIVTPSLKVHPVRSRSTGEAIYISAQMKQATKDLGIKLISPIN